MPLLVCSHLVQQTFVPKNHLKPKANCNYLFMFTAYHFTVGKADKNDELYLKTLQKSELCPNASGPLVA